jgi:photosystem II stability/assembly factor-like uncharacterized protein
MLFLSVKMLASGPCRERRCRNAGRELWGLGGTIVRRILLFLVPCVVITLLPFAPICAPAGAFTSSGDGSWVLQQTLPSGLDIRAASFPDPLHGWAVDSGGVIWVTADGSRWDQQGATSGALPLYDVSFADAVHGCAVGYDTILVTSDGGAHWNPPDSGATTVLDGVCLPDASHGWAVGFNGTILATSDGGAHWSPQSSGTLETLFFVSFPDASHGWVVGDNGTILATSDGGAHWTPQSSGTAVELLRVVFLDDSLGWIVGDLGTILATNDGGAHWYPQFSASGTIEPLDGVAFTDASHGWTVGKNGTILATTDGVHWNPQDSGTSEWLHAICFPDPLHGWAFGDYGIILATNTGGIAPPHTVATGARNAGWYNHSLTITLTASAEANPVASITYALDGASPQTIAGMSTKAPIPVNARTHANDGPHVLSYTATDTLGLAQFNSTLAVNIDTRKPSTRAPYAATAARGRTAILKCKVLDASPNGGSATVVIKVKNHSGTVVKTLRPGARPLSKWLAASFTVPRTWKAGAYRFYVYATDKAGNTQANIASNSLTVR